MYNKKNWWQGFNGESQSEEWIFCVWKEKEWTMYVSIFLFKVNVIYFKRSVSIIKEYVYMMETVCLNNTHDMYTNLLNMLFSWLNSLHRIDNSEV